MLACFVNVGAIMGGGFSVCQFIVLFCMCKDLLFTQTSNRFIYNLIFIMYLKVMQVLIWGYCYN